MNEVLRDPDDVLELETGLDVARQARPTCQLRGRTFSALLAKPGFTHVGQGHIPGGTDRRPGLNMPDQPFDTTNGFLVEQSAATQSMD